MSIKLSSNSKSILNDGYYIEKRESWFARLDNLFNKKPDIWLDEHVFALNGITGRSKLDMYQNPEEWIIDSLEDLAKKITETEKENVFVPACLSYGPYGVHFIDKIFCANVFFKHDQWWNDYIKTPIGSLEKPDIESSEAFGIAKRACLAFLDQNIRLPLFGLPTIASALNIIVNLYGQEFLMAMLTDEEAAAHDLRVVQDILVAIHQWYRKTLPAENRQLVVPAHRTLPRDFGQAGGCSTALISADCYNSFVAPLDAQLLGVYPNGGMMHLCGGHVQHIKTFRNMKELRAVQLNDRASYDIDKYYNELRDDQIIYLNPCDGMTAETALEITGGNRLVLVGNYGGLRKRH